MAAINDPMPVDELRRRVLDALQGSERELGQIIWDQLEVILVHEELRRGEREL